MGEIENQSKEIIIEFQRKKIEIEIEIEIEIQRKKIEIEIEIQRKKIEIVIQRKKNRNSNSTQKNRNSNSKKKNINSNSKKKNIKYTRKNININSKKRNIKYTRKNIQTGGKNKIVTASHKTGMCPRTTNEKLLKGNCKSKFLGESDSLRIKKWLSPNSPNSHDVEADREETNKELIHETYFRVYIAWRKSNRLNPKPQWKGMSEPEVLASHTKGNTTNYENFSYKGILPIFTKYINDKSIQKYIADILSTKSSIALKIDTFVSTDDEEKMNAILQGYAAILTTKLNDDFQTHRDEYQGYSKEEQVDVDAQEELNEKSNIRVFNNSEYLVKYIQLSKRNYTQEGRRMPPFFFRYGKY